MTSVEFLENQYNTNGKLTPVDFYQAKEMEKQETLEEYIKEVTKNFGDEMSIKFTSGGIKLGAKWQQEQDLSMVQGYLSANLKNIELLQKSYSEEDLREAFKQSREAKIFEKGMPPVYESFEEWFEQHKKC
jgi:hypothetical protein